VAATISSQGVGARRKVSCAAEDPADRDAFFAECIGRWITFVGLT